MCDLAVAQALHHQLHDLKFPRRQRAEGRRTETLCASRLRRFAECGDPCGKSGSRFPCQQGLQEAVVFRERHHKAVRPGVRKRLLQPCVRRLGLAQPGIRRCRLDADVQRHQRVVHRLARRQQLCAAPHHLGIRPLGKIHLVFDHFHHGLARREQMDVREPVLRKDFRNLVRFAPQRMIIGARGAPDVDP